MTTLLGQLTQSHQCQIGNATLAQPVGRSKSPLAAATTKDNAPRWGRFLNKRLDRVDLQTPSTSER
jgi:hypothetical protein